MRKKVLPLIAICVLACVVWGCTANKVSLVDKNQVLVEKQDSEKVELLWIDVYQKDGQT